VDNALGEDSTVRFVSFTVDPARDTPAVLEKYADRYQAEAGRWYFLTGSQGDLQKLSRTVFQLGDTGGNLEHSTRFVLIDKKSRIRGYYLTAEEDAIPRLIADAKKVLKEHF
jgi:protein SCO1/2